MCFTDILKITGSPRCAHVLTHSLRCPCVRLGDGVRDVCAPPAVASFLGRPTREAALRSLRQSDRVKQLCDPVVFKRCAYTGFYSYHRDPPAREPWRHWNGLWADVRGAVGVHCLLGCTCCTTFTCSKCYIIKLCNYSLYRHKSIT